MGIGRTRDVGVVSGREVDPLDQVQVGEELERAKDCGSPNGPSPRARGDEDILGGEVTILLSDRLRDGAAGDRQALASAAQCSDEGVGLGHRAGRLRQLRLDRN